MMVLLEFIYQEQFCPAFPVPIALDTERPPLTCLSSPPVHFLSFCISIFLPLNLCYVEFSCDKTLCLNQMLLPVAGWGFSVFMGFLLHMSLGSE